MIRATSQSTGATQDGWLTQENFYRLVLIAIVMRIILMPFFGHVDVLSEARRIYFWDQSGHYFDDISRNATFIFQLLFYKVFSVFIPNEDVLFLHQNMSNSTANPVEYFEFVSNDTIFRVLFVIKLPFFVADLVVAWCVYHFCGGDHSARRATVLWLFNPLMLFAVYIFGRFEAIPVMYCALGLLALQRERIVLAAIAIGLSINSRELFIFLGPVFIALMCSRGAYKYSLSSRVMACGVILLAVAISVQLISLTGGGIDTFGREVSSIATEGRVDELFKFIVGSYLMFPMVYFAVLLYTWNNDGDIARLSPLVFALTMVAFFLFSSHTAHYASWFMLFPCLYYARNPYLFKPVLALYGSWLVYNLAITDLGVFTTWLASPLSIHFSGLPNFPAMYYALGLGKALDLLTFSRVWSTFYRACLIYLTVQMVMVYYKDLAQSRLEK